MEKKLTRTLLLALVLSLGFGQLLRFEFYGLPFYLHDLLVVAIILVNFCKVPNLVYPSWFKLITLGLVVGALRALTLFAFASLLIPGLYTLRLLAYLVLYLIINKAKYTIHKSLFIISGLITLTIGLWQYLLLPDMRIFQFLGWDDHLNRLTLPHFDPTFTATMLVLSLLYLRQSRPFRSYLYIIPSLLGILLTYARSVWLSLALAVMIYAKNKLVSILIISLLAVGVYYSLPRRFGEGTNLLRTYSFTSRLDNDLQLARKVNWNFISGIGYNTLSLLSPSDSLYDNHANGFNNSFLTILATSGLIGLVGWILFLKRIYLDHPHLRIALTFVLIGSLFNNLLLYPFVLLWLFTVPTST